MRINIAVVVSIVAAGVLGFVAGVFYENRERTRPAEWALETNAVDTFFMAVPGFKEQSSILQPLLEKVQSAAIKSIKHPPRDARQKESYRLVVALFLVQEDFTGHPEAEVVAYRGLNRVGLAPWWIDPDPRYLEDPKRAPGHEGAP